MLEPKSAVSLLAVIGVILSIIGICKPAPQITACGCLITGIAVLVLVNWK